MTKNDVLDAIKRTATENEGVALGKDAFFDKTGIKQTDWCGKYWIRWSDAVNEAGFKPNQFSAPAYNLDNVLRQIALYTRELGHYPTHPELKIKKYNDKSFPTLTTIKNRFGSKKELLSRLLEFCRSNEEFIDVIEICKIEVSNLPVTPSKGNLVEEKIGFVYLMKSGRHYKIGKANHVGSRHYQIGIKLPEKLEVIHEITTDDPFGIERYWHNRFKEKRKKGEWFDLSVEDISAFKRRSFM